MNLASGLNLMMTSQCHNKRLSLCFVCLGANILLFENDNQHVILMSTFGSPTKQINQTFVLETLFFSKIPIWSDYQSHTQMFMLPSLRAFSYCREAPPSSL